MVPRISYLYFADNLLASVTDSLSRITTYNYDANGNVTSVTRLSGTSNAVTTTLTYDPTFNQVTSVADPLNHATSFSYATSGNLSAVADPLQHQTTLTHDTEGNILSIADVLGNTGIFEGTKGALWIPSLSFQYL